MVISGVVNDIGVGSALWSFSAGTVATATVVQRPVPRVRIVVGSIVQSIELFPKLFPLAEKLFDELTLQLLLGGALVFDAGLEGPQHRQQSSADAEEYDREESVDGRTAPASKDPPRHPTSIQRSSHRRVNENHERRPKGVHFFRSSTAAPRDITHSVFSKSVHCHFV